MGNTIHDILSNFKNFWDNSLNGECHPNEVNRLAQKAYELHLNEQQISQLPLTDQVTYRQAVLLYECLVNNRKK